MVLGVVLAIVIYLVVRPPVIPVPTPSPSPTPTVSPPPPTFGLAPVEAPELGDDGEVAALRAAIAGSLEYLRKKPAEAAEAFGPDAVPFSELARSLEAVDAKLAEHGLSEAFFSWLRGAMRFYESTADEVRYTGYHLASLRGSRKKTKRYKYPLYRRPKDMLPVELHRFHFYEKFPGLPRRINARVDERKRVVPYYSRAEIDYQGKLKGKGLEILWGDSPADIHSLHVQGSGVVQLAGGGEVLVGFADSNGLKFKGIGSYLLEEGRIASNQASYQSVQRYLRDHPVEVEEILSQNARYIFFRELSGGPVGSLGVELTPHRSIAVDHDVFPSGALALVETTKPVFDAAGKLTRWVKFRRLVLAQDAGAAIKSSSRVDLYCGYGPDNEKIAGSMHQAGRLWFLRLAE